MPCPAGFSSTEQLQLSKTKAGLSANSKCRCQILPCQSAALEASGTVPLSYYLPCINDDVRQQRTHLSQVLANEEAALRVVHSRLYLYADHAGWLKGQNLLSWRVGQVVVVSAGQLLGGESTQSVYSFSMFPAAHTKL